MQTGYVFQRGQSWVIKFYETVLVDGKPVRRRVLKRLATKGDEYPDEKSVATLAAEILEPVNRQVAPASAEALASFLEHVYLPACQKELRPSTAAGYEDMLRLVKPHLNGLRVREVEPRHIDKLLRAIAATPTKIGEVRAHTTMANCRNFLSGAFRYAIREALYSKHNPVREIKLPKGLKRMDETYAYSFAEVQAMLKKLQEPARTVVMAAAFSGYRLLGSLRQLGFVCSLRFFPARAAIARAQPEQVTNVYVALAGINQIVASLTCLAVWIGLDGFRQRFLEGC
jgi:integrase